MSAPRIKETCIFCQIGRGDFDTELVGESAGAIAINDIHPAAPIHVLVMPRAHYANLHEVDDPALLGECLTLAADAARKLGLDASGYRLVCNNGRSAGQSVFHLHFHILGGREFSESLLAREADDDVARPVAG